MIDAAIGQGDPFESSVTFVPILRYCEELELRTRVSDKAAPIGDDG